ncbi:hypothetical protein QP794_18570 [Paenibacillus sp. UMB7766-LJ446]|nr:hypothetical protein [Paenibacillus sp. UMB7766-LJ446]
MRAEQPAPEPEECSGALCSGGTPRACQGRECRESSKTQQHE